MDIVFNELFNALIDDLSDRIHNATPKQLDSLNLTNDPNADKYVLSLAMLSSSIEMVRDLYSNDLIDCDEDSSWSDPSDDSSSPDSYDYSLTHESSTDDVHDDNDPEIITLTDNTIIADAKWTCGTIGYEDNAISEHATNE
jgi:hypothetical protein